MQLLKNLVVKNSSRRQNKVSTPTCTLKCIMLLLQDFASKFNLIEKLLFE